MLGLAVSAHLYPRLEAERYGNRLLVLADGANLSMPGSPTAEPVYGLPAYWVSAATSPAR